MGMVTGIWAAADEVTITGGEEDAVTITVGIEAAVTATIITEESLLHCRVTNCPDDARMKATRTGRALEARPVRPALNRRAVQGLQPSPISTAIRIRSEWFLAPSFCFSRDVVLATVL